MWSTRNNFRTSRTSRLAIRLTRRCFIKDNPLDDAFIPKKKKRLPKPLAVTPELSTTSSRCQLVENTGVRNDEMHLLGIFPAEIWMLILDKVSDNKVLENMSNSSLYFRELLAPRRNVFLFESVWNVMANKFDQSLYQGGAVAHSGKNVSDSQTIENPSLWYIDSVGAFKRWFEFVEICCMVCSHWRHTVNEYYEKDAIYFNLPPYFWQVAVSKKHADTLLTAIRSSWGQLSNRL